MVNLNFLPIKFSIAIRNSDIELLSELRFRTGFPVLGVLNGKKVYFNDKGISFYDKNALQCGQDDITEIINNVTERSLYAFNDRLKQGFITTKDGVRIGVAGECVFDNGKILTIKKITSLNIRIPHEIKNCSAKIYDKLFTNEISNTLIVSPPSKGKTTILKDLARNLNERTHYSILIIDERGEFVSVTGENIDVIKFSDKFYALNYAIRSMSPQILITDELQTKDDWKSVENAVTCGVKVVASCHGKDVYDLQKKDFFKSDVFEKYVVLDAEKSAGTISGIFDKSFNEL